MDLRTPERALYVEGLGHIDQYGSYVDDMWTKGVVYFVRDYYLREIERRVETGEPFRSLVDRLNALNSDITKWEQMQVELSPPKVRRQNAHGPVSPPLMPGLSWADLAEDDPEMRLMGPPPELPTFVDPDWLEPARTSRGRPVPIRPFLTTSNAFSMLHQMADEEVTGMPQSPPGSPEPTGGARAPSPSPRASRHSSGPATAPSTSASEAPRLSSPPAPLH
jgi:hypothetical protein